MADSDTPSSGNVQSGSTVSRFGAGEVAIPEWVWPALVPVASIAVVAVYLLTHPYPAYGAGFYLQVAEQILANDYGLPTHIPLYTDGGVPFAYPPLMFYVSAVLLDAGVSRVTISLLVPAVSVVLYPVVYYFLAEEFLPTRRQAGLAAALLAVTPAVLQWHISAGGIVRGPAFLFALTGIYAGVQVFKRGERKWVAAGLPLFALTMLSHPVYTVFFGTTWLLLYVWFDRSLRGLVAGAVVAGGGVALTSPWWLTVASAHGIGIFFSAAGTHNGLGGGLGRLAGQFVYVLDADVEALFFLGVFAGAAYHLYRRRWFLPAWLFVSAYVIGKERFQFVAGAMLLASLLLEGSEAYLRSRSDALPSRRTAAAVALGATVVFAGLGGLYAAGALNINYDHSSTQPAFIDADDQKAMEWAAANTDASDDFVVLGDAAEWFPLLTDRAILVGPWGVEWTSPEKYNTQLSLYHAVSTCESESCLTRSLAANDVSPEYVYLPKGEYTVRGKEYVADGDLRYDLLASDSYRKVYENQGAVVFRVTDSRNDASAD